MPTVFSPNPFALFRRWNPFWLFNKLIRTSTTTHVDNSKTDVKEVEFHSSLSSSWWDDKGTMAGLKALNRIRVPFIRDGLINCGVIGKDAANSRYSLKDITILDVGCGGGVLSEALARIGGVVTGLEPSKMLVEVATHHAKDDPELTRLSYINSTIEEYAINNKDKYDVVISSEVIEHVTDKESFLKNCIATLKPGGSLFMTTPNRTFFCWFMMIVIGENFGYLPKGLHDYDKFIGHETLEELLKANGCRVKSVQGFVFNPLTFTCDWSSHKLAMYAVHAVKDEPASRSSENLTS